MKRLTEDVGYVVGSWFIYLFIFYKKKLVWDSPNTGSIATMQMQNCVPKTTEL